MNWIKEPSPYLDIVKNNVGNMWIEYQYEKIKRYYNTDKNTIVLGPIKKWVNPLCFLIYQAEKNITQRKTNPQIPLNNDTVDISRLGSIIQVLQNKDNGFEKKFVELCNADHKLFEKIFNELDVASGFVKWNHRVEFLKTRASEGVRTPDLLIDGSIEVECKMKDKLTPRDILNEQLWDELQRESIQLMNTNKKYYLLYAFFDKDLDSLTIKKILGKLEKIISSGTNSEFNISGTRIIAEKICNQNEKFHVLNNVQSSGEIMRRLHPDNFDKIIGKKISKPEIIDYNKNKPDYDHTPFKVITNPDGSIVITNVMKFLFKSKKEPDRIKRIMRSINEGKGQLSDDKIGMIWINISHISQKFIEADVKKLGKKIKKKLKKNPGISAIGLTSEHYIREKEGVQFSHRVSIYKNENASRPLPADFNVED